MTHLARPPAELALPDDNYGLFTTVGEVSLQKVLIKGKAKANFGHSGGAEEYYIEDAPNNVTVIGGWYNSPPY